MRNDSTERLGVVEVEKLFLQFNWIPRTVFQTDVGIDMTVEICKNGNPIGKFIGVQIKSGDSYFKEKSENTIIFRSNETHINYWLNNSLPILIVLHDLKTSLTIWEVVNRHTVESTGKTFKIKIPLSNTLEKKFADKIERLTEKSPLLNSFQKLILDRPIIGLIAKGEKVVVELRMWIKKPNKKADITIYHVLNDDEISESKEGFFEKIFNDEEILEQKKLTEFTTEGITGYQSLYYFYNWADFKLDESFYESFTDYDDDNMPGYKLVFLEDRFRNYKLPVIPYHIDGNLARYRLRMSLNEYGYSIINFFDYLIGNKQLKIKFDKKYS